MMMYLGTLAYQANSDAVRFFLEKVYPAIKKQVNGVKFVLVSGYEPEWLGRYLTDASINYVKDSSSLAAELFLRADVLVVPIRIASGTNIKILEAMAAGLPVVTTSIGAEGLEVKNGENILISDQPSEIAKTVAGLLQDGSWREKIGRQARKLVEKRYDWLKTTERLIPVYHELSDA